MGKRLDVKDTRDQKVVDGYIRNYFSKQQMNDEL